MNPTQIPFFHARTVYDGLNDSFLPASTLLIPYPPETEQSNAMPNNSGKFCSAQKNRTSIAPQTFQQIDTQRTSDGATDLESSSCSATPHIKSEEEEEKNYQKILKMAESATSLIAIRSTDEFIYLKFQEGKDTTCKIEIPSKMNSKEGFECTIGEENFILNYDSLRKLTLYIGNEEFRNLLSGFVVKLDEQWDNLDFKVLEDQKTNIWNIFCCEPKKKTIKQTCFTEDVSSGKNAFFFQEEYLPTEMANLTQLCQNCRAEKADFPDHIGNCTKKGYRIPIYGSGMEIIVYSRITTGRISCMFGRILQNPSVYYKIPITGMADVCRVFDQECNKISHQEFLRCKFPDNQYEEALKFILEHTA
eukprot:GHVP01032119.1.p1 GENE.GHVP01032119.1~~GHVP01032119.1.p1  ORF type:complete len:362 (-),score=60.08 GHVP01032119.1:54-1139(-)